MLTFLLNLFRPIAPDADADAGAEGERVAAEWLQRERKFAIVARNWRSPRDRRPEIDLVCRDGVALVFVEVKARAAHARVPGYFAVTARKKRLVRRAAKAYLARLREKPVTIRFDVVEVEIPPGGMTAGPTIRHFENVPLFGKHFRG